MAKVSAIQKNKHRVRKAESLANKRAELKKIIYNRDLPFEERFQAQVALAELPRNSSKIRVRNRCEITGRPRGFYRKMRISRIALRDLASSGELPGVVKSSW